MGDKGWSTYRENLAVESQFVLPWVTGRWYNAGAPGLRSIGTGLSPATGILQPVCPPNGMTWTSVTIEVATAAAAGNTARIGLYSDNFGYPFELLQDFGEAAIDAIAVVPISISRFVPAGFYWIAVQLTTITTVQFRTLNDGSFSLSQSTDATPTTDQCAFSYTPVATWSSTGLAGQFPKDSLSNAVITPRVLIGV